MVMYNSLLLTITVAILSSVVYCQRVEKPCGDSTSALCTEFCQTPDDKNYDQSECYISGTRYPCSIKYPLDPAPRGCGVRLSDACGNFLAFGELGGDCECKQGKQVLCTSTGDIIGGPN